ncbi:MAG: YbaN family protein [Lachnospiraceae bacterium]|nr:YbaN family protein [Lachnospiraceae bacterium]
MKIKKIIYITIGCICLGLGALGIALPFLPTTPFFLVTAFCFAKSSEKLENWFKGTKLYKNHLESFVKKEGMLPQTKASILISVSLLMGIGFFFMAKKEVWIPCIILSVVWAAHMIYFLFIVKTIKPGDANKTDIKDVDIKDVDIKDVEKDRENYV